MLKVSFTVKNNNRRFRKRVSGKYILNAEENCMKNMFGKKIRVFFDEVKNC